MEKLNYLSLFSGIGAFEKALDRQGIEYSLVNYCEIDKYASKSYAAVHGVSEDKNLWDVTKVDTGKLPRIDLLTWGFPCQDISVAGRLKGIVEGETRSGLYYEGFRILKETMPKISIIENVKNLVSKRFRADFESMLEDIERLGYNNYWQVLNAKDYGVPQNRERVFIVSIRKDVDNGSFRFPEGFALTKRLRDILEPEVENRYYLKKLIIEYKACKSYIQWDSSGKKANSQQDRAYSIEGIAPTITRSNTGGNKAQIIIEEADHHIKVSQATKKRYAEAYEGDSINLTQPNSKTRRGMVGKQIANTIETRPNQAVVLKKDIKAVQVGQLYGTEVEPNPQAGRVFDSNYISPALDTMQGGNRMPKVTDFEQGLRIRKLTPKECWRLMGFDDTDIEKAQSVGISNSQLYKQAGNSIVVNVLEAIFVQLKGAVK